MEGGERKMTCNTNPYPPPSILLLPNTHPNVKLHKMNNTPILFNKPASLETELEYVKKAINNNWISGNHHYVKKCNAWFMEKLQSKAFLLTSSCTHALEMCALLLNIQSGDEIIMPSFTFVSTANAFVLRGAKIVFVDIRPDTLNMDETLIEAAITNKTRAIVTVHYAGVACEMDTILNIGKHHNIPVIEDAAQAMLASYKNKPLGTLGELGTYSFHETKNYTSGEGGALIVNNENYAEHAEIIQEKGTNRSRFLQGQVDKYTWVDIGSSYILSELNAAFLYAQLEQANNINKQRLTIWKHYQKGLQPLQDNNHIQLPTIPKECKHNAHMFYIKTKNPKTRSKLIAHLKHENIHAVFHYIPLHSSPAGQKFGRFHGSDNHTTTESERLLRLPLYYNLTQQEVKRVINAITRFYA